MKLHTPNQLCNSNYVKQYCDSSEYNEMQRAWHFFKWILSSKASVLCWDILWFKVTFVISKKIPRGKMLFMTLVQHNSWWGLPKIKSKYLSYSICLSPCLASQPCVFTNNHPDIFKIHRIRIINLRLIQITLYDY